MPAPFTITHVSAPESIEFMGSKEKTWFTHEDGRRWLFKANRPGTGEDWAEKIAAELCALLDIPHAEYEFALWEGKRGIATPNLLTKGERLVHGNELLSAFYTNYPHQDGHRYYRKPEYTLDLVFQYLASHDLTLPPAWNSIPQVTTASDLFTGYLLLDAWISNTDRHDQNWAIIERNGDTGIVANLAPTFDHASSLGRELQDIERSDRLTTKDQQRTVAAYLQRGRSAFHRNPGDTRAMHPMDAFFVAARRYPDAAHTWQAQLEAVSMDTVITLFSRIPDERISSVGVDFAIKMLNTNRNLLLNKGPV